MNWFIWESTLFALSGTRKFSSNQVQFKISTSDVETSGAIQTIVLILYHDKYTITIGLFLYSFSYGIFHKAFGIKIYKLWREFKDYERFEFKP